MDVRLMDHIIIAAEGIYSFTLEKTLPYGTAE